MRKPPWGLFLQEKGKQLLPLPSILTHVAPSHHVATSEGQTLSRDMMVIQEGKVESSKGKRL